MTPHKVSRITAPKNVNSGDTKFFAKVNKIMATTNKVIAASKVILGYSMELLLVLVGGESRMTILILLDSKRIYLPFEAPLFRISFREIDLLDIKLRKGN